MSEATTTPVTTENPTTPVPPTETFWEYLRYNIPNHLLAIGILLAIAAAVYGVNDYLDTKKALTDQQQVTATLAQKFQQIGPAVVSGNSTAPAATVTQQASTDFGPAVLQLMKQQGDQITSLTTALGETKAQVSALTQQPATFTPAEQNTTTGKLTAYPLQEVRTGAPALSSLNLFYDPTQRDPTKAFSGTTWTAYQEQFNASVGEWTKQANGGMSTTLKLSRTVSRPDPSDPTKMVLVGTEDIPLTSSSTVYTPSGILAGAPVVIPRWTLGLGFAKTPNLLGTSTTSTSGISAYGSLDYRVTNRYGVFVGTANDGFLGGVSIRLDAK